MKPLTFFALALISCAVPACSPEPAPVATEPSVWRDTLAAVVYHNGDDLSIDLLHIPFVYEPPCASDLVVMENCQYRFTESGQKEWLKSNGNGGTTGDPSLHATSCHLNIMRMNLAIWEDEIRRMFRASGTVQRHTALGTAIPDTMMIVTERTWDIRQLHHVISTGDSRLRSDLCVRFRTIMVYHGMCPIGAPRKTPAERRMDVAKGLDKMFGE